MAENIEIAFIYGSIARHEETEKSDVDLMLIGEDLSYSDFFQAISEIEIKLDRKINPTFYSPKEWKRKYNNKNHFVTNIIQQSKIFLIGTEDDLNQIR